VSVGVIVRKIMEIENEAGREMEMEMEMENVSVKVMHRTWNTSFNLCALLNALALTCTSNTLVA